MTENNLALYRKNFAESWGKHSRSSHADRTNIPLTLTYQKSVVKATYSGEKQENGEAKNATTDRHDYRWIAPVPFDAIAFSDFCSDWRLNADFVKILTEKTNAVEVEPSDYIVKGSNHWRAWKEVTMKRSDRKVTKTKSLSRKNSLLVAILTSNEPVDIIFNPLSANIYIQIRQTYISLND